MNEQLQKIAQHYGAEHQLPILQEECAELIQAVSKLLRAWKDGDEGMKDALLVHITEEIADVEIMLEETIYLTGISRDDISAMERFKIAREIGNIKAKGATR